MLKWVLIGIAAVAAYLISLYWPVLWAIASARRIVRVQRLLHVAAIYYERGKSRRATQISDIGLAFAGDANAGNTDELRRAASNLAATCSLAHGRMDQYQVALMMAHSAVSRDKTNPFAYEVLGMALGCTGDVEGARVAFEEGLSLAKTGNPPDAQAEDRIMAQKRWLSENAASITELYSSRD